MKILITGGAGFIGSNLVDHFLSCGHEVVCLDNLSTGFESNIVHNYSNPKFTFIEGDIAKLEVCQNAIEGCDYVCHQAALGSVPRSIADPLSTNETNISGFLNTLVAARDEKVKRFVYAASSSTYGDSIQMPKVESEIGNPLSPYAVTKYVNELYANVFANAYDMQCIGLRYFNVFGKRQSPRGQYAAVIPEWVEKLINHESPIINGDGSYSRDFTYIENVIQANEKALFIDTKRLMEGRKNYYNMNFKETKIKNNMDQQFERDSHFSEIVNIAYGRNTTLIQLYDYLRLNLAEYDPQIAAIQPVYGPIRPGDIPHSIASILKAQTLLGYEPEYGPDSGFREATKWYFSNTSVSN